MAKYDVYNLVLPEYSAETMNVAGYSFRKVDNYIKQINKLSWLEGTTYENIGIMPNVGEYIITATVVTPQVEHESVFMWAFKKSTAIRDILLLLALFTGREVFAVIQNNEELKREALTKSDSREYLWGKIIKNALGNKLGEGINSIYTLIRNKEWQNKYSDGFFLLLLNAALKKQIIETSFILCWTIWEHLYSLHNAMLCKERILRTSGYNKIKYIAKEYNVVKNLYSKINRIKKLCECRNRIIHVGKFPEDNEKKDVSLTNYNLNSYEKEAERFIYATEALIAKTLNLKPLQDYYL